MFPWSGDGIPHAVCLSNLFLVKSKKMSPPHWPEFPLQSLYFILFHYLNCLFTANCLSWFQQPPWQINEASALPRYRRPHRGHGRRREDCGPPRNGGWDRDTSIMNITCLHYNIYIYKYVSNYIYIYVVIIIMIVTIPIYDHYDYDCNV